MRNGPFGRLFLVTKGHRPPISSLRLCFARMSTAVTWTSRNLRWEKKKEGNACALIVLVWDCGEAFGQRRNRAARWSRRSPLFFFALLASTLPLLLHRVWGEYRAVLVSSLPPPSCLRDSDHTLGKTSDALGRNVCCETARKKKKEGREGEKERGEARKEPDVHDDRDPCVGRLQKKRNHEIGNGTWSKRRPIARRRDTAYDPGLDHAATSAHCRRWCLIQDRAIGYDRRERHQTAGHGCHLCAATKTAADAHGTPASAQTHRLARDPGARQECAAHRPLGIAFASLYPIGPVGPRGTGPSTRTGGRSSTTSHRLGRHGRSSARSNVGGSSRDDDDSDNRVGNARTARIHSRIGVTARATRVDARQR